jgi:hypothetical protein
MLLHLLSVTTALAKGHLLYIVAFVFVAIQVFSSSAVFSKQALVYVLVLA